MPPNVALTIGVTFSLVLLVYDVRRRTGVSAAVWLPTTLLMIIASRSFAQWGADPLEMGPQSGYQSSLVDVAFFFAVIVGSATVVTARKIKWTRLFIGNIGITLCYFYFGLSVLWSEDPIGSLKRWFKVFGLLAAVAVVLSEESPEEAIRALHVRCASVLLPLSVVLNKYFPNLARAYSPSGELLLSGVATQKNSLGQIAMILILFLVWDILETVSSSTKRHLPWDLVVLLFTGMYLLSASESKTSLVCVIVGAALLMRGKRLASAPVNSAVLLASLAMPCFMALTQAFSSFISPLTEMLGRDMTFTGRTPIWEAILAEGVVDPFFGAGYFNFWASTGAERVRAFVHAPGIHSAH